MSGATTRGRRWWALWLAALLGCGVQPWTEGEREEAFRLCRAGVAFPPINVLEPDPYAFGTYMCACQVDYLARRKPRTMFLNPLHTGEVNATLAAGRSTCLMRHRDGERTVPAPEAPPWP